MSTADSHTSTLETIELLQYRLQRLEFFLTGSDNGQEQLRAAAGQEGEHGVLARLTRAERDLGRLAAKSPVVHDLLSLYTTYPDLFQPSPPDESPTTLTTSELLAIISSCAPSFPTTASRLTSIKDLPIPPAEASASLIALKPRIARMEMLQESQGRELAELRSRSAAAIQRWYELSVLGGNDCWTEWEGRMSTVEKRLRREEGVSARQVKESRAYDTS